MSLIPILDIIGHVVDKVIPDPAQRAQLQLDLAKLADQEAVRDHEEAMGQIDVNKVEAASASLFVAGWRPAVGWGCVAALVYSTVLAPLFHFGMPNLDFLETVLLGMLGMTGTMRTIEKIKGVAVGTTPNPVAEAINRGAGQPNAPFSLPAPKPKRKKFLGIF
jgi:hypothetical protein